VEVLISACNDSKKRSNAEVRLLSAFSQGKQQVERDDLIKGIKREFRKDNLTVQFN